MKSKELSIKLFEYQPEEVVGAIMLLPETEIEEILNLLKIEIMERYIESNPEEMLPYFQA